MIQICQKGVSTETMETCLDTPLEEILSIPEQFVSRS